MTTWPSETLNDALIYLGYPDLPKSEEARKLGEIADTAVRTGPLNCSPKVAMAACFWLLQSQFWATRDERSRVARAFDCSENALRRAINLLQPYFREMKKRGWKP
jgi:hypothetical protein